MRRSSSEATQHPWAMELQLAGSGRLSARLEFLKHISEKEAKSSSFNMQAAGERESQKRYVAGRVSDVLTMSDEVPENKGHHRSSASSSSSFKEASLSHSTSDASPPEISASTVPEQDEDQQQQPTFPPAIGGSYVPRDASSVMLDPADSLTHSISADAQEHQRQKPAAEEGQGLHVATSYSTQAATAASPDPDLTPGPIKTPTAIGASSSATASSAPPIREKASPLQVRSFAGVPALMDRESLARTYGMGLT